MLVPVLKILHLKVKREPWFQIYFSLFGFEVVTSGKKEEQQKNQL